ncbi:hypothetical protein IWZ03DRAFT_377878 [Phyllosticta citriasiana]|uniref:Secreted protein n=1 Tax=Phyllosticta citriasiana TaxID=595635 RepID=A0ABR1KKK8_9PEZI
MFASVIHGLAVALARSLVSTVQGEIEQGFPPHCLATDQRWRKCTWRKQYPALSSPLPFLERDSHVFHSNEE